MRGVRCACALLVALTVVAGCSGSGREVSNRYGDCTFMPRTVWRNQDLSSIAASNRDLDGADLSGTNLVGADLRGADLTGASMINATLLRADLAGAIQTGITFCNTVMPDGTVTDCKILQPTTPAKQPPPPRILLARAHRPVRCIGDGIGDGIEVDFRTRNAQSVVFSVDDVRASDTASTSGIQRIPFTCDGHLHTVTVEAFGRTTPPASESFGVTVEEGRPAPNP